MKVWDLLKENMQESISKQLFCICPPRKQTRAAWGACAAAMRTSPPFATRPMVNCVAGKSEGYQSIRSSCRSHKRQIGHVSDQQNGGSSNHAN